MSVMPQVRYHQFLSSGTGLTGRRLGEVGSAMFLMNGVELQFKVDANMSQRSRNLQPQQWSGPEAIWVKTGNPLTSPWTLRAKGPGSGADNPEPQNVLVSSQWVAYYDSPGPSVFSFLNPRVSRVWVVQNFTGWVSGDAVSGGARGERLCEVVGWNSVISLADSNWDTPGSTQNWTRVSGSGSGLGWVDVNHPPAI